MNVAVWIHQVPDTDTRIRITADASGIVPDDITWIINPYDEFAIEAGLALKGAGKAAKVVLIAIGGADVEKSIKSGLALGADAAVRIEPDAVIAGDALTTARALAAAVRAQDCSLLLCGKQTIDDDSTLVPAMTAEVLGWPQLLVVDQLSVEGDTVTAARSMGGGSKHVVQAGLPCVVSCDKGLNTPRTASLKGIMAAKKVKIDTANAASLGVAPQARVQVSAYALPPARPTGRIINGPSVQAKVDELVRLLREEAKVL